MTDKTEAQPEALRLAAEFEDCIRIDAIPSINDVKKSAAELRRLHAEIQQLKAQLSARQAAPDEALRDALVRARDWFESQAKVVSKGCGSPWNLMQLRAERDAADAALTAAPPPPEREPLTDEQINDIFRSMYGCEPDANAEFSDVCRRVEAAHGIGATK